MYTYSVTEQLVRPNRVLFTQQEETEIFQQWRAAPEGHRKRRLHERVVMNYSPIVYKVVRAMDGYTGAGPAKGVGSTRIERDDLIQEGMMGLSDAANRFDLSMGWRFSTYARSWVRGVLYAYISRNYFIVNPCSNSTRKKMFFRLRGMIYRDKATLGSFDLTPEMAEIFANAFQTTPSEIMGMLSMFRSPQESLSETVGLGEAHAGSDLTSKQDMLVDPRDLFEEHNQDEQDKFRRLIVYRAVRKLRPRDQRIYLSQMARDEDNTLTLEDLGKEFGVSKERIRQLRDKASVKVNTELRAMISRGEITHTDLFG